MNLKETKKDLTSEIKKALKKSKLEVLTNENDFLVKNLKKAGWSTKSEKYFLNNKLSKLPFYDKIISFWMVIQNFKFIKYKISIKNFF